MPKSKKSKKSKKAKKVVKNKVKKIIKKTAPKKAHSKKVISKKAKKSKKPLKKAKKKTSKKVSAIPKGYNSITPYLIVNEAVKALDFYKHVFGAKEIFRMEKADGKIGHAEMQIGDTRIMLADEHPELNAMGPKVYGGSPISIHLYVENVDAVVDRAVKEGAILLRPVEEMYYGDRSGGLQDPFGHVWYVATHVEDVTPAEIEKRLASMCSHEDDACSGHSHE